ncbi:hypothetical protein [Maribacter sp.]|uniref:hypothetical protein n=1 Tax=Maribacter sp. TaxID=1897614 RepID=UPI0025BC8CEB|nr:hypothetical protein [Maribacter sp.]
MDTKTTKHIYTEWLSTDEMHEQSKTWFSELAFIKEEQQFLNHMILSFGIKTFNKNEFKKINEFKIALTENQRKLSPLFKQIKKHMNQLHIMLDDVNELEMEKMYQKTHKNLIKKMKKFLLDYRTLKQKGFTELSIILKNGKQKIALGNPDYKLITVDKAN